MREWENYCVGCPQGCINCGRKEDILIVSCDECHRQLSDEVNIYKYDGKELCMGCIFDKYGEDGVCEYCGEEAVVVDGYCEECIELDEVEDDL